MYTKVIQSGRLIEIFEYEKDPIPAIRRRKKRYANPRRRIRNVQSARASFFRLVRANIGTGQVPALLTLTMREILSLREGWRAFTLFAQRLRTRKKSSFSFVAVPEFQKRGAVHFHVLVWGLSHEEIARERNTRRIAELWGHGFVDIRATDGSPRLATYLAKYMFKAMYDVRLAGQKAYSGSRNLVRSVSVSNPAAVDIAKEQWGIGVDNPPLTECEYETKWLGRCNYQVFEI